MSSSSLISSFSSVPDLGVVVVCPPAQQEAQRAQFYVEKAKQEQRQKIIQAEGEAEAAKMVSLNQTVKAFVKS